jgi:hypothetical protein
MQVHVGEVQLHAFQRHVVGDADVAHVAASSGGTDGLHHRLLGADGLDDRVGAEPPGQLPDSRHPFIASLLHDIRRAELAGQALPGLVPAHRDDAFRAELLRGEDGEQADGTVPDHRDGLAGSGLGGDGAEPSGAEHVRGGEQTGDQVGWWCAGGGDEGAVGERHAHPFGLGAAGGGGFPVDASALVPALADLAGVVRGEERADDEVADGDVAHGVAHLLDNADVLVPHPAGAVRRLDTAVGPEVGAADAGRDDTDHGIGGFDDNRVVVLLDPDISWGMHNGNTHGVPP